MATATQTSTKTGLNLKLHCPECGHMDGTMTIDLNSEADERLIECGECGESFTAAHAAEVLLEQARRWEKVARWLDQAPEI